MNKFVNYATDNLNFSYVTERRHGVAKVNSTLAGSRSETNGPLKLIFYSVMGSYKKKQKSNILLQVDVWTKQE